MTWRTVLVDTSVVVAVIAPSAGLFASALLFFLNKRKERESEWRSVRIEQYRALVTAMSEVVGPSPPGDARRRLAMSANHVGLFASSEVLGYLTTLLDAVQKGDLAQHDEMLTDLMIAIRRDLGVPGGTGTKKVKFRLWAAGGIS
jgi:hypothetical protein